MELQITTLIENMPDDEELLAYEHGLSMYIEFAGKKILFDTGQTGEFVSNAHKLGKSLAEVDYFIISHGHYDHSGGVVRLMETRKDEMCQDTRGGGMSLQVIPMYVGQEFFHKKYKHLSDGSYRFNGNSFTEEDLPKEKVALHKVAADVTYLEENIMLFKNFRKVTDFEKPNPKFVVERSDTAASSQEPEDEKCVSSFEQDDFRDELALVLQTSKGLVVVVGCSHVGIVNILKTIIERTGEHIYSVIGGTHLVEADEERLTKTIEALRHMGLSQIAVSHCTGEAGMECVERAFGSNFVKNNTGHVYVV